MQKIWTVFAVYLNIIDFCSISLHKTANDQGRVPDKREYLMMFFLTSHQKPYVVTPHLNRLYETVQLKGHNICFNGKLVKIFPHYHHILCLI